MEIAYKVSSVKITWYKHTKMARMETIPRENPKLQYQKLVALNIHYCTSGLRVKIDQKISTQGYIFENIQLRVFNVSIAY